MFDITPIVEALIGLVAAIITAVLIPFIHSTTTAQQRTSLEAWVKIAVAAAEQTYKGNKRGQEKKEAVIVWLEERGIIVDIEAVDQMIEAAVFELNKAKEKGAEQQ